VCLKFTENNFINPQLLRYTLFKAVFLSVRLINDTIPNVREASVFEIAK